MQSTRRLKLTSLIWVERRYRLDTQLVLFANFLKQQPFLNITPDWKNTDYYVCLDNKCKYNSRTYKDRECLSLPG